eukprot:CAMPEP_0198690590 /NCGR_PEP_ID=MMETSP1468-20131203/179679_1 /TAXON_ID=1461545 /ORGANISM="Mantoniella sp, Strain CCMP1436" /LENGTH=41 /DNA_ID= /DNA_START= /DNA_END= /DNA_ORIENTATION=
MGTSMPGSVSPKNRMVEALDAAGSMGSSSTSFAAAAGFKSL